MKITPIPLKLKLGNLELKDLYSYLKSICINYNERFELITENTILKSILVFEIHVIVEKIAKLLFSLQSYSKGTLKLTYGERVALFTVISTHPLPVQLVNVDYLVRNQLELL